MRPKTDKPTGARTNSLVQDELLKDNMEKLLDLIIEERKRQDEKWGANRNLEDMEWLTILVEEVGESAEAILKGLPELKDEIVQIAAVALAWLECLTAASQQGTEAAKQKEQIC